ncbi:putative Alpha-(1,3)-fucosyltransferase C [Hypsibius exemplaris]|uniref:Fucosyltransferase n=1 Tax=Hypsibius exemplaris TaxID=2072580 RepID=A0A1W0WR43_HYPEX|nr:putative Alpha-(1,3)-fucosyltransferase C [Hypsibius exemplaris]
MALFITFCQAFTLRRLLGLAIVALLCLFLVRQIFYAEPHHGHVEPLRRMMALGDTRKVILFWTKFFGDDFSTHINFDVVNSCPVHNCFLTSDRSYLHDSTAVVFHADLEATDLPLTRSVNQSFVFYLLESPFKHLGRFRQQPYKGYFNLTWTYRHDSDVLATYYMNSYQPNLGGDRASRAKKKNKALALISNCQAPSNRDLYISELLQYFPVDVIGGCGNKTCPRGEWECTKQFSEYRFYLAFENALCQDYLTEKAFRAFSHDILPIVLGQGNYNALLPPNSFLNVADFVSPKKLAEHLHYLSRNPDEYEQHFKWKQFSEHSRIPVAYNQDRTDICQLCEIINRVPAIQSTYPDIHDWWVTQARCYVPLFSSAQKTRNLRSLLTLITTIIFLRKYFSYDYFI